MAILSLYVHYVFSIGYSTLKYWLNDILKLVATTKLLFATGENNRQIVRGTIWVGTPKSIPLGRIMLFCFISVQT